MILVPSTAPGRTRTVELVFVTLWGLRVPHPKHAMIADHRLARAHQVRIRFLSQRPGLWITLLINSIIHPCREFTRQPADAIA